MKIILMSVGTRGDMEPFLAIGTKLREKGHRVICAFPQQFRFLAEDEGLEFASLGTAFIEMLESDAGKTVFGGTGSKFAKFMANIRLARKSTAINKELIQLQHDIVTRENPDRIVYNGKAIYPIIWGIQNRGWNTLISPVPYLHYVRDHTHLAFNSNFGPVLNKLTYSLAEFGLILTVRISSKWLKRSEKITRKQVKNTLRTSTVIYTISPSLFHRPDYWNENLKVMGYQTLKRKKDWYPDRALSAFLEKHKQNRILFITFGSMTNPDPEKKTRILNDILQRNQIPAIINTASGGLVKPDRYDEEQLHFVSQIPYDSIFPHVYAVIHHGGSGTTHQALRYGCATMIIPHILDQFVWNKIIAKKGCGIMGIPIHKMTKKNLEPKILELMINYSFRENAEKIAAHMAREDFQEDIYQTIIG